MPDLSVLWEKAIGKPVPPGFDYAHATSWGSQIWVGLMKTDIVVARRLALLVELTRRDDTLTGADAIKQNPFSKELRGKSDSLLIMELTDMEVTLEYLKLFYADFAKDLSSVPAGTV